MSLSGTIPGMGHLWYIPTILFCYLLTPFIGEALYRLRGKLARQIILLLLLHTIIELYIPHFRAAWIVCYFIGYILGLDQFEGGNPSRSIKERVIVIFCLGINICIVWIDYIMKLQFAGNVLAIYERVYDYGHVLLGISLFLGLRILYRRKLSRLSNLYKLIHWSNQYSYLIYLTHHGWILGPLSLLGLGLPILVKVVLICGITIAEAFIIKKICAVSRKRHYNKIA